MSQPLDYKELLKKYMQHVMDCEGFSFLMHASTKASAQYSVAFTEEELTELRTIVYEVNDE